MIRHPARRWKTVLKAVFFVLAGLLTFCALRVSWISYSGRQEWAKTKAELLAKGEKLSLTELIPPPIPDEQNFFADPMWQELADLTEADWSEGLILQPRLPRKEQMVYELTRPFTAEERRKLETNFPEFGPLKDETAPGTLAATVWPQAAGNAKHRQRAAEFILAATAHTKSILSRLETLAERPDAQFPIAYELGRHAPLSHDVVLSQAARLLQWRAWAELTLGRTDRSQRDILTIFRLAEKIRAEPFLFSAFIRTGILRHGLFVIDTGIQSHAWSAEQLRSFEVCLDRIDVLPQFIQALRGERGMLNQLIESDRWPGFLQAMAARTFLNTIHNGAGALDAVLFSGYLRLYSHAFLASDQNFANRSFQKWIEAFSAAPQHGLDPNDFLDLEAQGISSQDPVELFTHLLSADTLAPIGGAPCRVVEAQNGIIQTRLACALERYRLENGSYPETLQALMPEYLSALPLDIISRRPMNYRRLQPEDFRLWSAGWHLGGESSERRQMQDGLIWGKSPVR